MREKFETRDCCNPDTLITESFFLRERERETMEEVKGARVPVQAWKHRSIEATNDPYDTCIAVTYN
jgi:hypothetical protein